MLAERCAHVLRGVDAAVLELGNDLVHETVEQPRPCRLRQRVPAGLPDRHVTGDRLRIAPASCAADQAVPVRSNASKISTISLPDLVMGPSGHRWVRRTTSNPSTPEGPSASRREPAENKTSHPGHQWPQD